jgi:hypothetical protein
MHLVVCSNRASFEAALHLVFDRTSIRGNSAGNLDIGYADMILAFEDEHMRRRAVEAFKEKQIQDYAIVD